MEREEQEMMVEYSEMTAFNFNSREFREVQKDVLKCKDFFSNLAWNFQNFISRFRYE